MSGREHARAPVPGDEPGDDGRHQARAMHVLGGDGGEEGNGEGDHRVHRGVGDARAHMQAGLAHNHANPESHEDGQGESAQDPAHAHVARGGRGDGGGEDHQSGGVIEEPFPLQDGDDAL